MVGLNESLAILVEVRLHKVGRDDQSRLLMPAGEGGSEGAEVSGQSCAVSGKAGEARAKGVGAGQQFGGATEKPHPG